LSRTEKINFLRKSFKKIRPTPDNINIEVLCPNKKCKSFREGKLKLVIQIDTQQYNCWVCGNSGIGVRKLINRYFPALYTEAERIFRSLGNSEKPVAGQEEDIVVDLPRGFIFLAESKNIIDPDIKSAISYAKSRNMSERDFWYFKLGAVTRGRFRQRVIMPSFDQDGELNYYVARSIFKDSKMKYINSKVPRKNVIFNEINIDWDEELTLVEGPFDLIKANDNATCLLGCTLKEGQNLFKRIVENNTPVCLALDPDVIDKTHNIAHLLSSYGISVRMLDCSGYEDVGTMSKEEFMSRLSDAKSFGTDDRLLNLISSIKSGSIF